jgi:hypothetical protein
MSKKEARLKGALLFLLFPFLFFRGHLVIKPVQALDDKEIQRETILAKTSLTKLYFLIKTYVNL